jgi:signal transduction histidine kinase
MAVSFRIRIMAIVLTVAVLPLGLLGLWLTRATARAGEALLYERLDQALNESVLHVTGAWTLHRSELLDLAEAQAVRGSLPPAQLAVAFSRDVGGTREHVAAPAELRRWMADREHVIHALALRALDGAVWWTVAESPAAAGVPAIVVDVDVHDGALGSRIGTLEARLAAAALFGPATPRSAGVIIGAFDPASGRSLLPLAVDPALLTEHRFALAGEEWLVRRRILGAPALHLVAAAPLTPFVRPLERVARTGTLLLMVVAATGVMLAMLLTGYLTRSLRGLAAAAEAVAAGDLEQRIPVAGRDEVSRVATAFNTMTESLQRTMTELADKRALAAVGEFAASLAHEIRNPLTSVQLDMQMVEERLPMDDTIARATQERALAEIRRLDRTVTGALRAARAGRMMEERVELLSVALRAARAAAPVVEGAGATISLPDAQSAAVIVRGDADALEQVLLNIMLNAAHAVSPGGRIVVSMTEAGGEAVLLVADDGAGIGEDELDRVFDPLYTTRSDGVGLGLAIARRLVEAHGGTITLTSTPGAGATARITLPQ